MSVTNRNPFSFNALSVGKSEFGDFYLKTGEIPNFKFDGSTPFTLGTFVNLDALPDNSSIYSQNTGFNLSLTNYDGTGGKKEIALSLVSPFCDFTLKKEDIEILTHKWYYICISYDGNKINVYFNGLKVKTFDKKNTVGKITDGDYSIGSNLTGYIKSVFVYKVCLTEEQISSNMLQSLTDTSNIIAWFDFTGTQVQDRSSNKIVINQGGVTQLAEIVDFVHVLDLSDTSSNGYLEYKPKSIAPIKLADGYTLLTKVYINDNFDPTNKEFTIFSNADLAFGTGIQFALIPESGKTNSFNLSCEINGSSGTQKIISSKVISSQQWVDVGFTYDNEKKITLYINALADSNKVIDEGDLVGDGNFTVGSAFYNTKPVYPFNGYIGYLSEFSRVLSSDDLTNYISNPPYVFSSKLKTLYFFPQLNTVELARLEDFQLKSGASLSFIKKKQSVKEEASVTIELSEDGLKKWSDYTPYEQWEIKTLFDFKQQFVQQKFQTSSTPSEPPLYQNSAVANRLSTELQSSKSDPFTDLFEKADIDIPETETEAIISDTDSIISEGSSISDLGGGGGSKGGLRISGGSSTGLSSFSKGLIIGGGVVTLGASALAAIFVNAKGNLKNEPQKENKEKYIQLQSIQFNLNKSKGSSISITDDGTNPVTLPEWKDKQTAPSKACYVIKDIESNTPTIQVQIYYYDKEGKSITGKLSASEFIKTASSENKLSLGNMESDSVTLKSGDTKTLTISLKNHKLSSYILQSISSLRWSFSTLGFINTSSHKTYTVFQQPNGPWKKSVTDGGALPWTNILDCAATYINKYEVNSLSEDTILNNLTQGIYDSGMKYEMDSGLPMYVDQPAKENTVVSYDLYTFNEDFKNKFKVVPKPPSGEPDTIEVSSLDCNYLLATLAKLHGIILDIVPLTGGKYNQGFHINKVQPLGFNDWQAPFANDIDKDGFLNSQAVAAKYTAVTPWHSLSVYDACFKLDDADTPTLSIGKKMSVPNASMRVGTADKVAKTYRGLLVMQNECNVIEIPIISDWNVSTIKPIEQNFAFAENY